MKRPHMKFTGHFKTAGSRSRECCDVLGCAVMSWGVLSSLTGRWAGSFPCGPDLQAPRSHCPWSRCPGSHSHQQTGCSWFPASSHRREGRSHRWKKGLEVKGLLTARHSTLHRLWHTAVHTPVPHTCTTQLYTQLYHTHLAKVSPMPLSANLPREERCFRRYLGCFGLSCQTVTSKLV